MRRIQVPALLLAVLMLLLPAVPALAGGFTISPASVNGQGTPGVTGDLPVYVVSNTSGRSIHVTMAVAADPASTALTPGDDWFAFEPAAFELAPGAEQEVGGVISIPADAVPGRYAVFVQARGETAANSGLSLDLALNARLSFTVVDVSPAEAEETAPALACSALAAPSVSSATYTESVLSSTYTASASTLVLFNVVAAGGSGGSGGGGGGGSGGSGGKVPPSGSSDDPTLGEDSLTTETTTNAAGQTVTTIIVDTDAVDQIEAAKDAGETAIEIKVGKIEADIAVINVPDEVLAAAEGVGVTITTPNATLELPKVLISALAEAGRDLSVEVGCGDMQAVQSALQGVPAATGAQVLGSPTEIKTSLTGPMTLTIPLDGITMPSDEQEQVAFLASLGVFVLHSDGTTQVIRGEIVNDEQGNPTGIRFTVDKFSTFTVIKLQAQTIVLTLGQAQCSVNGAPYTLDVKPFVTNNCRTMVPVRFISEALGAQVDWQAATNQVLITDGMTKVTLTLNSTQVLVNGVAGVLDAPAVATGKRTFVPLRFVGEALGAQVDYSAATQQITITR